MDFQEELAEFSSDRTFLGIFLTGVLLSFILSVNKKSFPVFLSFFLSGSLASFLVAASWTGIEKNYLRVIAVLSIFLVSGSGLLFYFQGQTSCLAWSAHSAENPVTNTCHAYIYGGCGPTPEPWYHTQCSPESKAEMCEGLRESGKDEDEKLRQHLCTESPEFNISVVERNRDKETMTLRVSESNIDLSNTRAFRIGDPDETLQLERNETVYNTSMLFSSFQESVFQGSIPEKSNFTVITDGDDLDNDSIEGVDSLEDELIHLQFQWWDRKGDGRATIGFTINNSRNMGGSWIT